MDPFKPLRTAEAVVGVPDVPQPSMSAPSGTVPEVLAWVGDDKLRAKTALEQERTRPNARVSLVKQLVAVIDGD